ncbi:MAG TPA: carboxypeptidase-like regulatory domain-containing protein [Acidobacteriaceae bacterium]|nr:carboxypeptidase-like regulatory domain-containing protein [Acidobacteriaceae bacterium]
MSVVTAAHAQQTTTPGLAAAPASALTPAAAPAQEPSAPVPQTGSISGTVTDVNGDAIPGATVDLTGVTSSRQITAKASDDGFFQLDDLAPGTYHLTVSMKDFTQWKSPDLVLNPGQDLDVAGIKLAVSSSYSITAVYNPVQIATQEVHVEEEQRVLGVIPNFYVVYDSSGVPLTPKLKFELAIKSTFDPATFVAANMYAGMEQAAERPDYVEGAKGYGQRLGSAYADGFTDILFGGAILPTILHQDPRYFYMGPDKGTKKHRVLYALAAPFLCKGDNGKWEPNYSSVGGDLISGAISNLYYPETNRGVGLVVSTAAIGAGGRAVNALAQEFLLRKLTTTGKKHKND